MMFFDRSSMQFAVNLKYSAVFRLARSAFKDQILNTLDFSGHLLRWHCWQHRRKNAIAIE